MLHFSSLNKAMIHQSPVTGDFARSLHPYPARFGCCDQKRKNVFLFLIVTFLHAIYATSIGPNKRTHIAEQTPFERYQPGKTNNCGSQSRPIGGNESDSSCKVSPSLHNLPARNSKQKVHPQCQRGTTDRQNRRSWTLLTNRKLGKAMRTVADFCYHFSVIQDHCRITEQEAAIVPPVVGTCSTRSRLSDESQNVPIVRERQEISFPFKIRHLMPPVPLGKVRVHGKPACGFCLTRARQRNWQYKLRVMTNDISLRSGATCWLADC